MKSSKIKTCRNHLGELYDALQHGNLQMVQTLEHELTPIEECVACTYTLQSDTKAKRILEHYLQKEGFAVSVSRNSSLVSSIWFWIIRFGIFSGLYLSILGFERVVWIFIFKARNFNFFSLNVFEFVTVSFLTVLIFIYLDDKLLD